MHTVIAVICVVIVLVFVLALVFQEPVLDTSWATDMDRNDNLKDI